MILTPPNDPATCRRCGTCCEQGGPALHFEDQDIVYSGALCRRDLVTIRSGEPVYNQRQGRILPAEREFVKLAGRQGSWCCKFFEKAQGCKIYGHRPLECRLLFCRDTDPLEAVIGQDLLGRRDLLAGDDPVLPWLEKLERQVAYREVRDLLPSRPRHHSTGENLAQMIGLVRADLAIREDFMRNFSERISEELFLLGRPLFLVIAPYGFRLVEGAEGVGLQFNGSGG